MLDELPPGLSPKLAPIATGLGEIFYYTLDYTPEATDKPSTREEQLMALRQVQEYTVKPLLRGTQGVAEVNTSGGYERYFQIAGRRRGHVLDPRTGWPVDSLASVTVVASNCLDAGLYATCALLRGDGGKDWLRATSLAHLCVERAGALHGLKLAG